MMQPVLVENSRPFQLKATAARTEFERKDYKFQRLIRAANERDTAIAVHGAAARLAGAPELEWHQDIAAETGEASHGGIKIPIFGAAGPLTRKLSTSGDYSVQDQVRDIGDYLFDRSVCFTLGAQAVDGLRGRVGFPRLSKPADVFWTGEFPDNPVPDSAPQFETTLARPHTLMANLVISRQLLQQADNPAVERFVRSHLGAAVAAAVDRAAIRGSGAGEPVGLLHVPDVHVESMGDPDGAAPSGEALAKMEEAIGVANGELGPTGWATTPGVRRYLRLLPLFTGAAVPCWQSDNTILGGRAIASNALPGDLAKGSGTSLHAIIAGAWSGLAIALWAGAELVVDGLALKKQGLVELSIFLDADALVVRPQAFAKAVDLNVS